MRLALALMVALWAIPARAAQYYIATTGDDADPCTLAEPCLTIPHVQAVINAAAADADVVTSLRGGTYTVAAGLEFVAADSGSAGHTNVWQSYPGENAIISGGVTITGWSAFSGDIFRAAVTPGWTFRQLYVNGVHAQRARGALNPAGWVKTATGYTAPDGSMAAWGNKSAIEIVTYRGWEVARCKVSTIVGDAVTMGDPCWHNYLFAVNNYGLNAVPSWIENAYELMASGSWYLDAAANYVYYWPPSGSMSGLTVIAPKAAAPLVSISGVARLSLVNLTIEHSNWLDPDDADGYVGWQSGNMFTTSGTALRMQVASVAVNNSSNVTLSQLTLQHLGSRAIAVYGNSHDVTVANNAFIDNAAGSIEIGHVPLDDVSVSGPGPTTQETNITVRGNSIQTGNEFDYFDNGAIFAPSIVGSTIANNETGLTDWNSISIGWGWLGTVAYSSNNSIANNTTRGACARLTDCGSIYSNGPQSALDGHADGLRVTGNFTSATKQCLYPDAATNWATWTGNVCNSTGAFFVINNPAANDVVITGNYSNVPNSVDSGTGDTVSPNVTNAGVAPYAFGTAANAIVCGAGVGYGVKPGAQPNGIALPASTCTPPTPATALWPVWGDANSGLYSTHP
jgi:hypothetical protein